MPYEIYYIIYSYLLLLCALEIAFIVLAFDLGTGGVCYKMFTDSKDEMH